MVLSIITLIDSTITLPSVDVVDASPAARVKVVVGVAEAALASVKPTIDSEATATGSENVKLNIAGSFTDKAKFVNDGLVVSAT